MGINKQAEELNDIIKKNNFVVYELLSKKGRAIFFPKKGILAQTAEAKAAKLNATIGTAFEDDRTIMRLNSIAKNILLNPKDVFPYAPSFGKIELRKAWFEKIKEKNPTLKSRTSLPIVTNAITHGLHVIAYLFVNPGDKIILTDKNWGNYKLVFEHAFDAVLDTFNTFKGDELDVESFKKKLEQGKGKKIVLLNFPNNPTGYTLTKEEAEEIAKTIREDAEKGNKIIVICDDAYFGLVYEKGAYNESIFSKVADLHENVLAIKADGVTKEEYAWGLRIGFLTYASKGITEETCRALESKTAGVVRGSISNACHLSQSLILKAFESKTYELEKKEKYKLLKSRFDKVKEVLKDKKFSEFFSALPYNSGYFMCIELKTDLDAEKIRRQLLEKYNTGVIAIKNIIRIAFSCVNKKNIPKLFENIYEACKEQIGG